MSKSESESDDAVWSDMSYNLNHMDEPDNALYKLLHMMSDVK